MKVNDPTSLVVISVNISLDVLDGILSSIPKFSLVYIYRSRNVLQRYTESDEFENRIRQRGFRILPGTFPADAPYYENLNIMKIVKERNCQSVIIASYWGDQQLQRFYTGYSLDIPIINRMGYLIRKISHEQELPREISLPVSIPSTKNKGQISRYLFENATIWIKKDEIDKIIRGSEIPKSERLEYQRTIVYHNIRDEIENSVRIFSRLRNSLFLSQTRFWFGVLRLFQEIVLYFRQYLSKRRNRTQRASKIDE
jgi:hypothetical protein